MHADVQNAELPSNTTRKITFSKSNASKGIHHETLNFPLFLQNLLE